VKRSVEQLVNAMVGWKVDWLVGAMAWKSVELMEIKLAALKE